MAINTAARRASVLGVGIVFLTLVVPSGAVSQADRQTVGHSYSGITAGLPVTNTPDCYVGFNSDIQESIGFNSAVDDDPVAAISTIDDDPVATLSTVYQTAGFNSIIDDSDVGFISTITDTEGFNSDICDDC